MSYEPDLCRVNMECLGEAYACEKHYNELLKKLEEFGKEATMDYVGLFGELQEALDQLEKAKALLRDIDNSCELNDRVWGPRIDSFLEGER